MRFSGEIENKCCSGHLKPAKPKGKAVSVWSLRSLKALKL